MVRRLLKNEYSISEATVEKPIKNGRILPKEKYCRKCGKELIGDGEYCRFCGARVLTSVKLEDKSEKQPINDLKIPDCKCVASRLLHESKIMMDTGAMDYDKTTTTYVIEIQGLYKNKEFDKAVIKADETIDSLGIWKSTDTSEVLCFESVSKFMLFIAREEKEIKKDIYWREDRISSVLSMKGAALIELGRTKEAEYCLKQAIEIDPTSTIMRNEYCTCLLGNNNLIETEHVVRKSLDYCLFPEEFARTFRTIGALFLRKGLVDASEACYAWSLKYEDSEIAKNEIIYIENQVKGNSSPVNLGEILCNENLEKTITGLGISPFVDSWVMDVLNLPHSEASEYAISLYNRLDLVRK